MPSTGYDEFTISHDEPVVRRSRFCGLRDFLDLSDEWLSASRFGRLFHLAGSGHVGLAHFV